MLKLEQPITSYRDNAKDQEQEDEEFAQNISLSLNPAKVDMIATAERLFKIVAKQIAEEVGCTTDVVYELGAVRLIVKGYHYGDDDLFRVHVEDDKYILLGRVPPQSFFVQPTGKLLKDENRKYLATAEELRNALIHALSMTQIREALYRTANARRR